MVSNVLCFLHVTIKFPALCTEISLAVACSCFCNAVSEIGQRLFTCVRYIHTYLKAFNFLCTYV